MLRAIVRFLFALPEWLRPPAIGAAILFGIVGVRIVFALPFGIVKSAADVNAGLVALFGATAAGAVGGFAYSFIGRPLRRVPVVGRYLAGIVCVGAYLAPLLLWGDKLFGGKPEFDFHDTSDVVICLVITVFFGVVMGQSWFRPPVSAALTDDDSRGASQRRSEN